MTIIGEEGNKMNISSLVNHLLPVRTGKVSLADNLDNLDLAVLGLSNAVDKLSTVVVDLILIADRPVFNQELAATAKTTMNDAISMLDKMRYLNAPGGQAPDTQPASTNRITPRITQLRQPIGKDHEG